MTIEEFRATKEFLEQADYIHRLKLQQELQEEAQLEENQELLVEESVDDDEYNGKVQTLEEYEKRKEIMEQTRAYERYSRHRAQLKEIEGTGHHISYRA